jgi:cytochrome c-type biogenesis protein CcmH/NrfG
VSWTPRSDLSNAQPAKASGNQPKATSSSDVVIAAPSDSGVRSTERTTELTDRGRNPVGEILRSSLTIEQHRTILQREVQTLAHASPWTILGIPQDVPAERLTKAGERMLSRYQQLLSHSDAGIRELAGQVLERVQWAIANATLAAPIERLDRLESFEAPGEDEGPFQAGFQQAEAACWAAADQAFSKARALSPGSARNLAWLGWARLQNPQVPLEKREEEGMEYLRLAEQFDPENVESRWFLATVYAKRGETDAAIRRLSRVLILQPHHAEAAALLKKLRQGEKK